MASRTSLRVLGSSPITHSATVHLSNTLTGVFILICTVFFFGWGSYGEFSFVIALSLLSTQVSVLGNPGLMIAAITNLNNANKRIILETFMQRVFRSNVFVLLVIGLTTLLLFGFEELKLTNVSPIAFLAIWVNTLFAPYNKIVSTVFTLPNTYLRFVFISILKNTFIVLCVLLAVLFNSKYLLIFSIAISELLISFVVTVMKRSLFKEFSDQHLPIEKINTSGQIPVLIVTIYYELLAKYDFFIFSLFMNPTTFGLYALLSNVNESIHAYLATVRTQMTPNFSKVGHVSLNQHKQLLRLIYLILMLIATLGFAFVYLTFMVRSNDLTNWPVLLSLLFISTFVMLKTLVFGGVYIQRDKSDLLAYFGTAHLMTLFVVGSIGFILGGIQPSLLCSILVNVLFSRYISRRIPGQRATE
jgi:hypothetical protein